jgi:hypothetical protein
MDLFEEVEVVEIRAHIEASLRRRVTRFRRTGVDIHDCGKQSFGEPMLSLGPPQKLE